jgi:pimeloyl-ACP methyl ester carboxylesterase
MRARLVTLLFVCLPAACLVSSAQNNSASLDSNGVQIHYVDSGQGTPVVLIHGFSHSIARDWEAPGAVAAIGKAGYRVIAIDCRGHGESGKPREPSQYGMEMVQDVIRLLDHLHITRAHIVGYSMGGGIANQLLLNHPERVLSVTLIGSGWQGEGEDWHSFSAEMQAMAEGFAKRDASVFYRRLLPGQSVTDAQIAALNASLFEQNDPAVLAAILKGMQPIYQLSAASLRATRVPVLAIVGAQDPANREGVHRMATVVPGLQVLELPGVTHGGSVKPSIEPMIKFLKQHSSN